MQAVTLKSLYGKSIIIKPYDHRVGSVELNVRDEEDNFKVGMILPADQVSNLRDALALPEKAYTYFLIRQWKDKPLKMRVCYANVEGVKEFQDERLANEHQERMTRQHGDKYNFFVVKKESK